MIVVEDPASRALESLARAVASWVERGDEAKLARWLARELDADGVPVRLPVVAWQRGLEILAEGRRRRGAWPPGCAEAIDGLARALLRFARPDAFAAMHGGPRSGGIPTIWKTPTWLLWYRGTGFERVLSEWIGVRFRGHEPAPPPLPTWAASDRVLAVLRPDWSPAGDFVAVDHRDAGSPCRFELFGGGRTWLGPEWGEAVAGAGGPSTRPRPSRWITGPAADLVEWTYRLDGVRITRSALLLRRRRLALFSILADGLPTTGGVGPSLRLTMPAGATARGIRQSRGLAIAEPGRRGSAQALPIALPARAYPTDRGSFRTEDRELIVGQAPAGKRCWIPLLVSWDADRHRKPPTWRVLTVSERSRPVAADRAFAARVSWGRDETYVVYRSLGPPARRAFLGHQTASPFLVAEFTEDGDLKPILAVD